MLADCFHTFCNSYGDWVGFLDTFNSFINSFIKSVPESLPPRGEMCRLEITVNVHKPLVLVTPRSIAIGQELFLTLLAK